LERRGLQWWCHRSVPPSLRAIVGKRNLRQSLKTTDLAEAMRLRPLALAAFAQQIETARKRKAGKLDVAADAAAEWQRFASVAVDEQGVPITEDVAADLIENQAEALKQAHGPVIARRFKTITGPAPATAIDANLEQFQRESLVAPKTKFERKRGSHPTLTWAHAGLAA
jgi:hypothetical protein